MRAISDNALLSECVKNLEYFSDTGLLVWRKRQGVSRSESIFNAKYAGKLAGAGSRQYRYVRIGIRFNGKKYLLLGHRVAWALHFGSWPDHPIDHINHDGFDNRIANLRLATCSTNSRNMKLSKSNRSGFTGVFWHKSMKKWRATVGSEVIGFFDDISIAAEAVQVERLRIGYHQNHGDRFI